MLLPNLDGIPETAPRPEFSNGISAESRLTNDVAPQSCLAGGNVEQSGSANGNDQTERNEGSANSAVGSSPRAPFSAAPVFQVR